MFLEPWSDNSRTPAGCHAYRVAVLAMAAHQGVLCAGPRTMNDEPT